MVLTIPDFYANKKILITGGTGFLGKVILEKLLRCCPQIEKIFLIIRSHRGKSPKDRLNELLNIPLFDVLRNENPKIFYKLIPIEGDIKQINLGLSSDNYRLLVEEVNIIFHVAASVRFDDLLSDAVKMNTRGTREALEIALKMKNMLGFIHVSTTYCNCDRPVVLEKIYPPHANWKDIINIVENVDPEVVSILTLKLLGCLPNTYTFSKSLSEQIVASYEDRLPLIIFRPSIVISSWKEPMPGWLDNFNGPVGMMLGSGKGIIRTCLVNPDIVPDYMPVDVAAKAIIAAVWEKATTSSRQETGLKIYNCSSMSKSISMRELMVIGFEAFWKSPEPDILWIPAAYLVQNETWFYINVLFKHLIPAILVDSVYRLQGKEPMLFKLQRRIYTAMISLSYFTLREWTFNNKHFLQLNRAILPADKDDFDYDFSNIDPEQFFENAMFGGRKYLLHQDGSKSESAKTKAYRIYWADLMIKASSVGFLFWYLLSRFIVVLF